MGAGAHTWPWHHVVPLLSGAADPPGTRLFPGGLSATVKSPPDFPSDKPNKLNFFRLIDQLTSERCNAATWIFFHAAYLASGHRGAESNVKLQRDQELCWSPHASARALRWVPKPTCNYLWLEGAPHGQKRNISSG